MLKPKTFIDSLKNMFVCLQLNPFEILTPRILFVSVFTTKPACNVPTTRGISTWIFKDSSYLHNANVTDSRKWI